MIGLCASGHRNRGHIRGHSHDHNRRHNRQLKLLAVTN